MAFYLDDAYSDEDLIVRITNNGIREGQTQWKGILTEALSFSASAEFNSSGADILDQLESKRQLAVAGLSLAPSEALNQQGAALQNVSLRLHKLTVKNWTGTADPVINISFAMVNNDQVRNVFEQYYDLHASLYPNLSSNLEEAGSQTGFALIAPYGYKFDGSRNRNGTAGLWSVDVGRWFTAHNMILSEVSLTSSLTLDVTPGDENPPMPMYAAVNCTFTTERAATQSTVRGWLRRNRNST